MPVNDVWMLFGVLAIGILIPAAIGLILNARKTTRLLRNLEQRHVESGEKIAMLATELQGNKENNRTILSLLSDLGKAAKTAHKADVEVVASEIKVLQNIVGQLAKARGVGGGVTTSISKAGKPMDAPAEMAPTVRTDYSREQILEIVQSGLRSDRVDLYIQPIVSLPQRKIRHFECLSRIRDEDGSIILPEQYVKIAESAGLMAAVDNLLLFRCIQLVRRANINNFHGLFFCNLSKHTMHDQNFFEDFIEFLKDNKELANRLVFEVSQADFDERDSNRERLLTLLSTSGCRLALSSVTYPKVDIESLDQCQFKFIKIEAATLQKAIVANPPLDLVMLRRILANHTMDLIVEKIESEDTLLQMLEYDIDFGQGFLFGEPKLSRNQS